MSKKTKIIADVNIYRKDGTIKLKSATCKRIGIFDTLVLNQPKKGHHIHIKSLKDGVITKEKIDGKEKGHYPLKKKLFNKLKK